MSDMTICKHGQPQGYCDDCSPGWEMDLIKADAADKIFARGVDVGRKELESENARLKNVLVAASMAINAHDKIPNLPHQNSSVTKLDYLIDQQRKAVLALREAIDAAMDKEN